MVWLSDWLSTMIHMYVKCGYSLNDWNIHNHLCTYSDSVLVQELGKSWRQLATIPPLLAIGYSYYQGSIYYHNISRATTYILYVAILAVFFLLLLNTSGQFCFLH